MKAHAGEHGEQGNVSPLLEEGQIYTNILKNDPSVFQIVGAVLHSDSAISLQDIYPKTHHNPTRTLVQLSL